MGSTPLARTEPRMKQNLEIVDAARVKRLLPMADCIDAMADAMRATSTGQISLPPRLIAPLIRTFVWAGGRFISLPAMRRHLEGI